MLQYSITKIPHPHEPGGLQTEDMLMRLTAAACEIITGSSTMMAHLQVCSAHGLLTMPRLP